MFDNIYKNNLKSITFFLSIVVRTEVSSGGTLKALIILELKIRFKINCLPILTRNRNIL